MDGLRALVVEDDDALSQLLEVLLTNKGFSVYKAVDIPGAMKTLRAGLVPDLVLLDVVLPGMPGKDGFLVLNQIRHTAALRLVPVIMVTSKVTDESDLLRQLHRIEGQAGFSPCERRFEM